VIYLTGVTNDRIESALIQAEIGLMVQPGSGYQTRVDRYPVFGADNGCFAGKWVEEKHFDWLAQLPPDKCLFAVSPDVYPDAAESLRRGLEFAPIIRDMGFPVAVVAQDGAERLHWPWDQIDCLFLGGQQRPRGRLEWKESEAAAHLAREARNAGCWVHMGRVNSLRRMERARLMGCQSADGTFLKWRKRRRTGENDVARHKRGEVELAMWGQWLAMNQPFPQMVQYEIPSHPLHRAMVMSDHYSLPRKAT
jgi:hypothetical protein